MEIEVAKKLVSLRAEGKSIRTIAAELKISKNTVCRNLEVLEPELNRATAIAKDSIAEEFKLTQIEALKSKSELFAKIKAQLDERDFSDVPTDRLLKLAAEIEAGLQRDLKYRNSFDFLTYDALIHRLHQ